MAKAKKAAAPKKAQAPKKATKKMLLVGSKTKEALQNKGAFMVSSDALAAINEQVYWLISQAQARATANGRKTIRPYDILA